MITDACGYEMICASVFNVAPGQHARKTPQRGKY
jgi:hypothetical protein